MALDHRGHGHSEHIPRYEEYHFRRLHLRFASVYSSTPTDQLCFGRTFYGGTIASIYSALCPNKPTIAS